MITTDAFLFLVGGIIIGVWGSVVGGAQFLALPVFQVLLPGAGMGVIIGNMKVGSMTRALGIVFAARRDIRFQQCMIVAAPLVLGAVFGAALISSLDQRWIVPAILVSIVAVEIPKPLAAVVSRNIENLVRLAIGIYAGVFGAGIALFLVALGRLREPADERIVDVTIQARFIELLLVVATVATHGFRGNLSLTVWMPWAIGSLAGGLIGGVMLRKMTRISGSNQKTILRLAEGVALMIALLAAIS